MKIDAIYKHNFNLAKSIFNSGDDCMNSCFRRMIKFMDERRVILVSAKTAFGARNSSNDDSETKNCVQYIYSLNLNQSNFH